MSLTTNAKFSCPYCMVINSIEIDEENDLNQQQAESEIRKYKQENAQLWKNVELLYYIGRFNLKKRRKYYLKKYQMK